MAEFFRFGVVGACNVAINAGAFFILVRVGIHYLIASACGATLGVLNSFVLSKFFVFKRKGSAESQLVRTLIVYAIQIMISWAGLIVLIEWVGFDPYLAYCINVTVVTAITFFGLKYFAFGNKGSLERKS